MALRDLYGKLRQDLLEELQRPESREDIRRVKNGLQETIRGAKSLSESVAERLRSQQDDPQECGKSPQENEPVTGDVIEEQEDQIDSLDKIDSFVQVIWQAKWNTQYGPKPRPLPPTQLERALALDSVEVRVHDQSLTQLVNQYPQAANETMLKGLRERLGKELWSWPGWEDNKALGLAQMMHEFESESIIAQILVTGRWDPVDEIATQQSDWELQTEV
jgi:hypothetical protein